jgi:formylglycine-generating enzyme required for sulfatase activity
VRISLAIFMALAAITPLQGQPQGGKFTDLITIPAGRFTMGNANGPADERPSHSVDLPAFSIERTPVTNRQFAEFLNAKGLGPGRQEYYDPEDGDARIHMRSGQWTADAGAENFPVVEPTWYGAREYCRWAGRRLPTEAEWEKAARGTDGRRYPWGNAQPDRARAYFGAGWREFVNVGTLAAGASPYGVLDMAGNAWEWTSSAYAPYPYSATDGRENADADVERATRGGGQDSSGDQITTTYRGRGLSREPRSGHHNIGFRCAR